MQRLLALALGAIFGVAAPSAHAAWPQQPIRVVIPFAPGNSGEIALRSITPALEASIGQKLVFDHRTGAAGNIGAQVVASAAPDGYTLLLGATNMFAINQFLMPDMAFDPVKAFAPITVLAESPAVLWTHPSLPARTLSEFIAYAKANPGKLNYGSSGIGTLPHLAVELLAQRAGIDLVHVPFRGSPPALTALLANEVQLFGVGLSVARGHWEAGRLNALAVTSRTRLPGAPSIPTVSESGLPGYAAINFWALAAPAGTDRAIIERIATAAAAAVKSPEAQARFEELGMTPVGNTPDEFAAQLAEDVKQWQALIAARGIKAQ